MSIVKSLSLREIADTTRQASAPAPLCITTLDNHSGKFLGVAIDRDRRVIYYWAVTSQLGGK